MSAFGWPQGAPKFDWEDLPMADHAKPVPHPFTHPHKLFGSLHKERPELWQEAIGADAASCSDFWKACEHDPDLHGHPALKNRSSRENTVQLGMHGDSGSISKHDSLLRISWNSLLGFGITLKTIYLHHAQALIHTKGSAMHVGLL